MENWTKIVKSRTFYLIVGSLNFKSRMIFFSKFKIILDRELLVLANEKPGRRYHIAFFDKLLSSSDLVRLNALYCNLKRLLRIYFNQQINYHFLKTQFKIIFGFGGKLGSKIAIRFQAITQKNYSFGFSVKIFSLGKFQTWIIISNKICLSRFKSSVLPRV